MNKIILLFVLIPCISIAASMKMIGEKGNPADGKNEILLADRIDKKNERIFQKKPFTESLSFK